MKTKEEIENRIYDLERRIASNEYWLEGMSNPMKVRRREKEIRDDKREIKILEQELNTLPQI